MKIIKVNKCPCDNSYFASKSGLRVCRLIDDKGFDKYLEDRKKARETLNGEDPNIKDYENGALNTRDGLTLTPTFKGDFPEWCPLEEI